MAQQNQTQNTQPDKNVAGNSKPSQAEGDRETIEQDLKDKESQKK